MGGKLCSCAHKSNGTERIEGMKALLTYSYVRVACTHWGQKVLMGEHAKTTWKGIGERPPVFLNFLSEP